MFMVEHTFNTQAIDISSLAFISSFHRMSLLARSESLVSSQLFPMHAHSLDISEPLWTFLSLAFIYICKLFD